MNITNPGVYIDLIILALLALVAIVWAFAAWRDRSGRSGRPGLLWESPGRRFGILLQHSYDLSWKVLRKTRYLGDPLGKPRPITGLVLIAGPVIVTVSRYPMPRTYRLSTRDTLEASIFRILDAKELMAAMAFTPIIIDPPYKVSPRMYRHQEAGVNQILGYRSVVNPILDEMTTSHLWTGRPEPTPRPGRGRPRPILGRTRR